ncbi:MAG TPA: FecR family protein, partial [Spirochaetota bacterium]|nr:FecR family protein [Spirochaetota bacterium]
MKFWTSISIVIAIAFASVCSYYLYREFTSHESKIGGEKIGTITFKKRSASRRFSESVMWEEIAQESPVYNYDAIRTLEYSSAVISLNDGTSIELDQNTMLVVILSQKGVDINFDRGGVSAKSGAGGKQLITLNARDASIALDSGDISVSSSDKGMNISLESGSAKIEAAGGAVNITADETATLKEGKVQTEKRSLFTEFPANYSYLLSSGKSMSLEFRWRSEPVGVVKVEIARSSRFTDVFKSFSSGSLSREVELPPGDYYWRIVSGKNKSFPAKFTIMEDRKPELIYPRMNQNVSVSEGAGVLPFKWVKSRHASGYEVKLARDPEMKDVAATLVSKINSIA